LLAGTFGQVLKVKQVTNGAVFALKVIRNRRAFRRQAQTEVELLERLRLPAETNAEKAKDKEKDKEKAKEKAAAVVDRKAFDARALVVQLYDHFVFQSHLCLLFEPLGVNLLQLLQQNKCIGLSTSLIRYFCKQLLQVLTLLSDMGICHCDLKPENILLQNLQSPAIKLIDFGSACYARQTVHSYIQSRFTFIFLYYR
jgi:dual specificity protein kinase YAK1